MSPFDWVADADPRLGPVLEAYIDGKYYWVPLERAGKSSKSTRRKICAMRSGCRLISSGPTAATPSASCRPAIPDPKVLILRSRPVPAHRVAGDAATGSSGLGQRMFTTGEADVALMDLRTLELSHPDSDPSLLPSDAPDVSWPILDLRVIRAGPMAELGNRERLQPALLDRLTDNAPDRKHEAADQQVLQFHQLRLSACCAT